MRIGWVMESWMPASSAPIDFCAARPSTTPATPAEASSETPTVRTTVNCISSAAMAKIHTTTASSRRSRASCVRTARAFATFSWIFATRPSTTPEARSRKRSAIQAAAMTRRERLSTLVPCAHSGGSSSGGVATLKTKAQMGRRSGPRADCTSWSSQVARVILASRARTARPTLSRSQPARSAAPNARTSPTHCHSSSSPRGRAKSTSGSSSPSGGPYAS